MKQLTSEEIQALFNGAVELHKHYKKRGKFMARTAVPGESVLTIVSGKLETIKTAGDDEFVLRNIELGSSAESYIIPRATYENRYAPTAQAYFVDGQRWHVTVPTGEVMAFKYTGEAVEFAAPWGEKMICEDGDFLANPVGGSPTDVYRIEKETFEQTYGG